MLDEAEGREQRKRHKEKRKVQKKAREIKCPKGKRVASKGKQFDLLKGRERMEEGK